MLTLFAQRAGAGAAGGDAGVAAAMASMLIPLLIILAIGIAVAVFYCLTLSKALKQVRPELREMEPGQVWLYFIPFFNLYWIFVIASKVPASLKAEFYERGIGKRGDDYGANIGKWYAICTIASIVPFIGGCFGLVGLVMWIMFWVKIAGYSKELQQDAGGDYDLGDEEDDRPRKKPARDEYDDEEEEERPRKKKRRADDYDDE